MDKKAKKRLEVLKQKRAMLEKQLAGARKQTDDPAEVTRFENELEAVKQEMDKLQGK
ncbi:MAG: hypothetical protein KF851_04090 [Pirellulaceae bacterium]|jgi:hypothetical protein|nr:hypothetical protein [Pirellulaceae bacterium]